VDNLVDKLGAGEVDNDLVGIVGDDVIADGLHQMRLAQPYLSVDKKRIVHLAWLVRDRLSSRCCKLTICSHHKVVEGVFFFKQNSKITTQIGSSFCVHNRRLSRWSLSGLK